ncbi:MAG: hypothetical protein CTY35_14100 [Methylotenera sp.]|nr:cupredoxin family protein [Methylotenera sp.]PPC90791.1 MAG: hypothetical protein CTY35_14100 [Methylotenera sp.]
MKQIVSVLALTSILGLPALVLAHGDVEPKHGGVVALVKDIDYELVAKPDSLTIYVEDHGKVVDTKAATAKVTMLTGSNKTEANLTPAGENKLEAKGKFDIKEDTKVISIVTIQGKPATTVRFELKQDMHHDEHANHKHGADSGDSHSGQTAYGIVGDPKKVTRTIKLSMGDNMRFSQDNISIKQGETIKFVVANQGKILHEMVIGTIKDLQEHAEMMKQMPGMQHNDPNMVSVKPSYSGDIVWTFNKAGQFDFACLQPGHSEAGMKGKLMVVADNSQPATKAVKEHEHMDGM